MFLIMWIEFQMICDLFSINQPVGFNHSFSLKKIKKNVKNQIGHYLYFWLFTFFLTKWLIRQDSDLAWQFENEDKNYKINIGDLTLTDMVPLDFIVYPSDSVSSKRVLVLVLI